MTQEEKQLLLTDLCGRLLYEVKVQESTLKYDGTWKYRDIDLTIDNINCIIINFIKPYLFPLSSMTSKQKAELSMIVANEYDMLKSFLIEIEFYHKHHFDYRGLIQKGLAIDCTNLNIY
jgi:hypothetical protein